MIFRKILSACIPLIFLSLLILIEYNVLIHIGMFIRSLILGLVLGSVLAYLPKLVSSEYKSGGYAYLFSISAIVLFVLLLYQYFTYTGDVYIPALSFLNVNIGITVVIESCILGYTTTIAIMLRKTKHIRRKKKIINKK